MSGPRQIAVWFPTVRTGTGTDVFTERLAAELTKCGVRTEIKWLPLRAEYAPWTVPVPKPPEWVTVAHINTWLHSHLVPTGLPFVATIHHSVHHAGLRPYKGVVRAFYHHCWVAPNERRVLRSADRVVAVSQFVAETARRTLVEVPMEIIYNGVDTQCFFPGVRQLESREPFRLLYVGSWKALKGTKLFAPLMRELGEGFELRYTGGSAANKDRHRFPQNMHDIGRLNGSDSVSAEMRSADAFLFPSKSEGFGLVVAEAMACGLPVIATRGSSLVEVVEDGVTGILFSQDDVTEAAHAIRRIQSNLDMFREMGLLARRRAERCFSLSAMAAAYMELYGTLVEGDHVA